MPSSTQKTTELVREAIEGDPVVKQGLQEGLLNIRALARRIQVKAGRGTSLEAVVSAIRRYPIDESALLDKAIGKLVAKLSMRDGVSAYGVTNSKETWRVLSRFPEEIDVARGDVFRVISGLEATTVVIDSKNADRLRHLLPKASIGKGLSDLAEIVVHLNEPSWETTGVLARLATELALSGVNVYYHFSYGPPPCIAFEVRGRDAVKAYEALERVRRTG